jgi:hypothetical protein
VVNDGQRTVMYVAGCEVVDNPSTKGGGYPGVVPGGAVPL